MQKNFFRLLSVILLLQLIACGSGSGGGLQSFTISAGDEKTAVKGQVVNLIGVVETEGVDVTNIEWTQVSGLEVAIADSDELNASFVVDFFEESMVTIKLVITDSSNNQAEDLVNVAVNNHNEIFADNFDNEPNGNSLIISTEMNGPDCQSNSWQHQVENMTNNNYQISFDVLDVYTIGMGSHYIEITDNQSSYKLTLANLTPSQPSNFSISKIAGDSQVLLNNEEAGDLVYDLVIHNSDTNTLTVSYFSDACSPDFFASAYFELDRFVISNIGD